MITTFATTKDTNDLYLGPDGNLVLLTGIEAVEQLCLNAAKTKLGEMVLQTDQGVNYDAIFSGIPNVNQFEASLLIALQTVPGVNQVLSLNVNISGDTAFYTAEILTDYGSFNLKGNI